MLDLYFGRCALQMYLACLGTGGCPCTDAISWATPTTASCILGVSRRFEASLAQTRVGWAEGKGSNCWLVTATDGEAHTQHDFRARELSAILAERVPIPSAGERLVA